MVEEYAYFYWQRWPLFAAWLALVLVMGKVRRQSPWHVALWMPTIAVAGGCTLYYLKELLERWQRFGGDSFGFGMAFFYLVCGVPIACAFVALMFMHPVRSAWKTWAAVAGGIATILAPVGIAQWFEGSKPIIEFRVVDTAGQPISGVSHGYRISWPPGSPPSWRTVDTSDANGLVAIQLPHRSEYRTIFHSPGYQDHMIYIGRTGLLRPRLSIGHNWYQNHIGLDFENSKVSKRRFVSIPIEMRAELANPKPQWER
jgi:hypothetical protein